MKKQSGFTLIELMIVVAIVAILAAIALPAYQTYTARARYTEIIAATGPLKQQVELCFVDQGSLDNCDTAAAGATNRGAGWSFKGPTDYANGTTITSITVTDGIITVVPVKGDGILATDTYILEPTANKGSLTWANDGTTDSGCIATSLCS